MSDTANTSTPVLLLESFDNVRILRLNRPEKKNALSNELVRQLVRAFEEAASDNAVRVVGITGQGGAFSSGADLSEGKPGDAAKGLDGEEDDLGTIGRLVLGIRLACDKPVIAGIDGIAMGAGLALAMCADMRIASSAAILQAGYARAGSSPDAGLSWTLPQAIGHERTMRFLLEQEKLDADAALALGMVGEVADVKGFDTTFLAYCARIAEVAPIASRQTKRLVTRAGLPADLESQLRDELAYAIHALTSRDGKEAIRAIVQKRKPVFSGE